MRTNLKNEIYKSGLNINQLCTKAQISRFTLNKYFSGKNKRLRGDTIYLIAKALNKDYDYIYSLVEREL